MKWNTTARRLTMCGFAGFLFVWMWFRPVFWNMTETRDGFGTALWDIFVAESTPEYMLGAGVDQLGTFWIFGSLTEILQNGGILPSIFHPIGWDIGWHTGYAWLDGLISLPLQILGVPTFYNLHVALTLWLSFMGICWLFVQRGQSIGQWILAPLVASLALWTPFGFEEISMGRPTQLYWIFSTVFFGLLVRGINNNSIRWYSVLLGLMLTCSCFVYWFGGVAVGFCGGVIALCQIYSQTNRKRFIGANLIAGLVAIGSSVLITHKMLFDMWSNTRSFEQLSETPITYWSVLDLPIYSATRLHNWNSMWQLLSEHPSTLPVLCLGLLGCLVPYDWKERFPWMIGWILSLGIPLKGALLIGDWTIPTGQGVLQWVFPLLLRCEYPERMVVAPTLLSIILCSLAFSSMNKRITNTRWRGFLTLTLMGSIGLELTPPRTQDLKVSSVVVDEVRLEIAHRFPGGMIDVPFSRSENTYIQQLFHKQPLLGGPGLNRVQPAEHIEYCNSNGLLSALEEMDKDGQTRRSFTTEDIQKLIDDGFSVLLYDPQSRRIGTEPLEEFLGIDSDYLHQRTGIRVYTLKSLLKRHSTP